MRVTIANYEQYFIDYLDGNLSDREIGLLEDFLHSNPGLRNELEGLEKVHLRQEKEMFPYKESLKKPDLTLPVCQDNFEDFCIASAEGDLNYHLIAEFQKYFESHPEKITDYLVYKRVHLIPDYSTGFRSKNELKKPVILIHNIFIYVAVSIAAAIVLVFLILQQPKDMNPQPEKEIALNLSNETEKPDEIFPVIKNTPHKENSLPGSKKNKSLETSLITTPFLKEKVNGVSKPEQDNEKSEEIIVSELPLPAHSPVEVIIPVLTEKDLVIPVTKLKIPVEENKSSVEYLSIRDYARKEINEKVLGKKDNHASKLSVWDIAEAGINGIGRLTGNKMNFDKKTGRDGKIETIAFESRLISFSTSVNTK